MKNNVMLRYFIVKRIYYEFQWTNCSHIGLVVADLSDFHCSHLRGVVRQVALEVSDGQRVCYASVNAVG